VTAPAPDPDTTAPTVSITGGPAAGSSTTATGASFSFSSSEPGTFSCRLDAGAADESCASPKAYSGLSVGEHTFTVRATDAAGNVSAAQTRTWTVTAPAPDPDTTPPGPVTGLVATADDARVDLRWTNPTAATSPA
jgi:predicted phage tail protein